MANRELTLYLQPYCNVGGAYFIPGKLPGSYDFAFRAVNLFNTSDFSYSIYELRWKKE